MIGVLHSIPMNWRPRKQHQTRADWKKQGDYTRAHRHRRRALKRSLRMYRGER